jgi:hypothetical protein
MIKGKNPKNKEWMMDFLQLLCVGGLLLLFGLVVCFSGYRFFLLLLPLWGFFAGFALGAGILTLFGDGFLATVSGWVLGFIVGLIFAVLSYLFWIVGVALFAGSVGYMLGAGLVYWIFPDATVIAFVAGMAGALVVAGLTLVLNLQKLVIVLFTAFGGATILLASLMLFLGKIDISDIGENAVQPIINDSLLWLLLWLGLAVVGTLAQYATTQSYVLVEPEGQRTW